MFAVYAFPASGKTTFRKHLLTKRGVQPTDVDDIQIDPELRGATGDAERAIHSYAYAMSALRPANSPFILLFNYHQRLMTGYLRRAGFTLIYIDLADDVWESRFELRHDLMTHTIPRDQWRTWRRESQSDAVKSRFDYILPDFSALEEYATQYISRMSSHPRDLSFDAEVKADALSYVEMLLDISRETGLELCVWGPMLQRTAELDEKWKLQGKRQVVYGHSLRVLWPGDNVRSVNDQITRMEYAEDTTFIPTRFSCQMARANRYSSLFCYSVQPEMGVRAAIWRNIQTPSVRQLTFLTSRILLANKLDPHIYRRRAIFLAGGVPVEHPDVDGFMLVNGRMMPICVSGHLTNILVVSHYAPIDIKAYLSMVEWNYSMCTGRKMSTLEMQLVRDKLLGERNYGKRLRDLWHNDLEWQLAVDSATLLLGDLGVELALDPHSVKVALAAYAAKWSSVSSKVSTIANSVMGRDDAPAVPDVSIGAVPYRTGHVVGGSAPVRW
jgi:hypothetical protein